MKTANELADALGACSIDHALNHKAADMLRSQAAEIESLRKANIDCKLHFDTLKADYDALKADATTMLFAMAFIWIIHLVALQWIPQSMRQ